MPDDAPIVEETTSTTTKATTEASAAAVLAPVPALVPDDYIRKALAIASIIQFIIYVSVATVLVVVYQKDLSATATNIIIIILTAEIGFLGQCYSYYMGGSSGSTLKSAQGK